MYLWLSAQLESWIKYLFINKNLRCASLGCPFYNIIFSNNSWQDYGEGSNPVSSFSCMNVDDLRLWLASSALWENKVKRFLQQKRTCLSVSGTFQVCPNFCIFTVMNELILHLYYGLFNNAEICCIISHISTNTAYVPLIMSPVIIIIEYKCIHYQ